MGGGPIGSLESKSETSGGSRYAEFEREDKELNEKIRILNEQLVTETSERDVIFIETDIKNKEKRIK